MKQPEFSGLSQISCLSDAYEYEWDIVWKEDLFLVLLNKNSSYYIMVSPTTYTK